MPDLCDVMGQQRNDLYVSAAPYLIMVIPCTDLTSSEWALHPPRCVAKTIGGRMARGIIGGFIGVILAGLVAALLSSHSNGALIHMLGGVTPAELIAEAAKHPGPAGPPGSPAPAGTALTISLAVQGSADFDKSAPIPNSETAPICMLSKIILRRYVQRPDRSCELTPGAQRGQPWRITVDGAVCGVTCFAVGTDK